MQIHPVLFGNSAVRIVQLDLFVDPLSEMFDQSAVGSEAKGSFQLKMLGQFQFMNSELQRDIEFTASTPEMELRLKIAGRRSFRRMKLKKILGPLGNAFRGNMKTRASQQLIVHDQIR
ncbi:MAG: hypothetical protein ACXWP1_10315, partial [Bdellovibrionota bacterium]